MFVRAYAVTKAQYNDKQNNLRSRPAQTELLELQLTQNRQQQLNTRFRKSPER